jgi:hypothetical protein
MTNAHFVDVVHTGDNLLEKLGSFIFLEPFSLHYIIKKLSSAGVLHYKEKLSLSFNDLNL